MKIHRNPVALAAWNSTGAGPHKHRAAPRGGVRASMLRDLQGRCPGCRAFDADACDCPVA